MVTIETQLKQYVAKKINGILTDSADGPMKAALANLRRGVGRVPGDMPELWGALLDGCPEILYGAGHDPSRAEWAMYTALTLFAVHQQGHDPKTEPMSASGQSFGAAVRKLAPPGDDDALERVLRRFNGAATASDMTEMAYYLRGLVQLMRAEGIALDYPALAADLYRYQFPERTASVRLAWGEDFYRTSADKAEDNKESEDK